MLRIFTLLALSSTALAHPSAEGPRGRPTADPPDAAPPPLVVANTRVEVDAGPAWQSHDVVALCGIAAPGARVRVEEVAGDDAAAAADVALDGPTTLRLRATAGSHVIRVEVSATDARGNQAFDRCNIRVR